jgi:hypothetical protein
MLRPYGRLAPWPHPADAVSVDQHRGIAEHLDLGHLAPAARACRPAAGNDLTRADEQGLQSRSSVSGRRM